MKRVLIAILVFLHVAAGRSLAATVTVNSLTDGFTDGDTSSIAGLNADPGEDGVIILREAIAAANNNVGNDTILFSVSGAIEVLGAALPTLEDFSGVTIDGGGVVTLKGSKADENVPGLTVYSSNNVIRRLRIVLFSAAGIYIGQTFDDRVIADNVIQGCQIGTDGVQDLGNLFEGIVVYGEVDLQKGPIRTQIGGAGPGEGNLISGNGYGGIAIDNHSNESVVEGNLIGTDASGTTGFPGGYFGIRVTLSENCRVGGATPGASNVVAAHSFGVVLVRSSNSSVMGNFIGTDKSSVVNLGNDVGIFITNEAACTVGGNNRIGGTASGAGNVIGFSLYDGLLIENSRNNTIQGNFLGVDPTGTKNVGNGGDGIRISTIDECECLDNMVGGTTQGSSNIIAFNGNDGITVEHFRATRNSIRGNSIFSNFYQGIDISGGANAVIDAPIVTNPRPVQGTALPSAVVELFVSDDEEGKTLIDTITADGAGAFSSLIDPAGFGGAFVTATQTDASGNTSEFSVAQAIPSDPDVDNDGLPDNQEQTDGCPNWSNPDSDDDTIQDGAEVTYGLNPCLASDALSDTDGDGLTARDEINLHHSDPGKLDSDEDGLNDGVEVANGMNPANANDADEDLDNDGLVSRDEVTTHLTNPTNPDTDGDQMPDGWEVDSELNPIVNDALGDADSDGVNNRVEYQVGTDPNDPLSPVDDVYVNSTAINDAGEGTLADPWKTIQFAISQVAPFATETHSVTVHVAPGVYNEQLVLSPNVIVSGSDPANPHATVIQYREDLANFRVITAALRSGLNNCKVQVDGSVTGNVELLRIENVSMSASHVIFDGALNADVIGLAISGIDSSASVIRDCSILRVREGVRAVNSGANITRCLFDNIQGTALLIELPIGKTGPDVRTLQLGAKTEGETTGFNQFRSIGDMFVKYLNANPTATSAQFNDWGLDDPVEAKGRVSAAVQIEPIVSKRLGPGTLVVDLLDAVSGLQIPDSASPEARVDNQLLDRDVQSLLYAAVLPEGTYSVNAQATDLVAQSVNKTIDALSVEYVSFSLSGEAGSTDLDGNNSVDAVDVQLVVNGALGLDLGGIDADVDKNGSIDAVDVQLVINAALGIVK